LRVSGGCLEFVPIVGASRYVTLPVAVAAPDFRSMPLDPLPVPAGARVAVQADGSAYALASPGPVSPAVVVSAPAPGNEVTVTFATPHRFVSESATRRYFLIADPISYCVDTGALYRYVGYGFNAAQPGPGVLPATLPGRSLMVEQVATALPFTLSGATLTRNAVVVVDMALSRGGDTVRLEHLVQVRNVP
jgi:MSHA biogenesis protein MshO